MAKKKQQFEIFTVMVEDATFRKGKMSIDLRDVVQYHEDVRTGKIKSTDEEATHYASRAVTMSSNRLFEMFCDNVEVRQVETSTDVDGYSFMTADIAKEITEKEVNVASEFIILDFSHELSLDEDEKNAQIAYYTIRFEQALRKGIWVTHLDGTERLYKRVVRSASQTRTGKAYFTCLDVHVVRTHATYGAFFLTREGEQNLAKLEARVGLATSSTMKLKTPFKFDVLPDHEVSQTHANIIVGSKVVDGKRELNITEPIASPTGYNTADGQGYVRPRMATKWALEARIINHQEYLDIMIMLDLYDEDLTAIYDLHDEEFNKVWNKVPSAFQVRFGLCKGLLIVFPFHLEQYRQDCNKQDYRDSGLVMEYWEHAGQVDENGRHYYDFDTDVMFTDSMWKENFDPAYLTHKEEKFRPTMELVLWNGTAKEKVFMGYQFWQALGEKVSIRSFAKEVLRNLQASIFTDAKQALMFLGTIDGGQYEEGFEDHLLAQNSSIAKVQYTLMQNPDMINDRFVKQTLRKVITRFVERMRDDARIPVEGANPYIIADPMPTFGLKPVLKSGQNYYNNMKCQAGGFRSPLVDESEATVLELVKKKAFRGLFRNTLVLNWFDDTLPRMGGADTDGDKIALIFDERIIKHIKTGLPMIVDAGEKGSLYVMNEENIANYDMKTILPEANGGEKVYGIGEITNFSTIWKDILMSPKVMAMLQLSQSEVQLKNRKLRGLQGVTIDYAKTGVNVPMEENLIIHMQPAWKKGMALSKHLRDEEGNIKVYVSESQMQLNWNYVNKVLENFEAFGEDVSDNNAYTFLSEVNKLDVIDFDELEELTQVVSILEADYRNAMGRASMYEDEEERMAYIVNVIDMYRFAVDTLPFPSASVAAIAYQICYNASSSKGKSVSFVWNCCFTGLARLMEATEKSLLLRTLKLPVDVCYAPKVVNVYKQEFEFEYKVGKEKMVATGSVAVPNGQYNVHVEGDRAFIEMKAGVASTRKAEQIERRVAEYMGQSIVATMTGIKYTDFTASQFVEALKANNGELLVVDGKRSTKGNGTKRALSVEIDGNQYGIIAEKHSGLFLPIMDGAGKFEVLNYETLSPTYVVDGAVKEHVVMTLTFVFKGNDEDYSTEVEEDEDYTPSTEVEYDGRDYQEDSGIPYYADMEPEAFEDEEETEASYMKVDYAQLLAVAPKKYSDDVSAMYEQVIGFDVERHDNDLTILVYRKKAGVIAPATANMKILGNGQIKFADEATIEFGGKTINAGEKFTTLLMQIAKYAKSL